jgi:hypothetical protein
MELYNEIFAYKSDKSTPFIYKTNDLSKFNNYEFNRDLDLGHVKILANKIKDFSLCPLICTIDNGNVFILDGQHRLEVAKRKNVPIYYRLIDNVSALDIAELQVKKNWSILNWVKYWAYHGKKDYVKLMELHDAHGITPGAIASLMTTDKSYLNTYSLAISGGIAQKIATGKFIITNEQFGMLILKQLQDYPTNIKRTTRFIKALVMANTAHKAKYSMYDHEIMKKRLVQYPEKIEKKTSTQDYLRMIEDVMNTGVSQQNRFRFF